MLPVQGVWLTKQKRTKGDKKNCRRAGIRFAEMWPTLFGRISASLNFRHRSLVKKWPGTMQLLLQDRRRQSGSLQMHVIGHFRGKRDAAECWPAFLTAYSPGADRRQNNYQESEENN